uniref:SH3 domain-containing protein n=1 Tax=Tianweitania sp. TaxID=2021634 RepID=UPI002899F91A
MTKLRLITATAGLLLAATGASLAQTAVSATTDLNLRAGPGPQYPVVGTLGVDETATLDGCAQGSKWCQVTVKGQPAWAYSDYLTSEFTSGSRVIVTERPAEAVPVVEYRETAPATTTTTTTTGKGGGGAPGAAAGTIGGVVVGALIGGPVGAA